jgi:hypothetical protein
MRTFLVVSVFRSSIWASAGRFGHLGNIVRLLCMAGQSDSTHSCNDEMLNEYAGTDSGSEVSAGLLDPQ